MTEWAKFVSGVMFLDYTSGRMPFRSLPLPRRQRGAGRALLAGAAPTCTRRSTGAAPTKPARRVSHRQMASADDAFMGALEAAERELKAGSSSSSAQTPATDAAESNSPAGGPSPTAPYAASDDEPDGLSPTVAAASSGNGEAEHGSKERSRRGSDERRSSGGSDHHRRSKEGDSRSTFKARVIKEVKTGAATSPASALPKPARRHHARSHACTLACTGPQARATKRRPLRAALRQRCTASSPRGGSRRGRTSRSWRARSRIRS